ncbi:MAG TPA: FecR family protein [Steroidobacteraceae bacterium]|nr:FecR family protein [Steroidobacteraceae bacterium]
MTDRPDSFADTVLNGALSTPPLSEASLARVRTAVAREWRATAPAPGIRLPAVPRRSLWIALPAAALLAAVSVLPLVRGPSNQGASIGFLTRANGGSPEVSSGLFRHRTLATGEALRVGDRFTTRGAVLFTLARGGTLRVAAGSTLGVTASTQLSLERGLIYLDVPLGPAALSNPLRITTRQGAIEHIGTEFEVMSDDQQVRIRVREGRIRFHSRSSTFVADAGTELLATPGNEVVLRSIDNYGADWAWTAALAPDYAVEGQPLMGFLQWVGRELGRRVDFDGAHAREVADRTILYGSVRGQTPLDALANVLAATSLTYQLSGDEILIASSR